MSSNPSNIPETCSDVRENSNIWEEFMSRIQKKTRHVMGGDDNMKNTDSMTADTVIAVTF